MAPPGGGPAARPVRTGRGRRRRPWTEAVVCIYILTACSVGAWGGGAVHLPMGQVSLAAQGAALVPPGGGVVSSHREVELSRPTGRWSYLIPPGGGVATARTSTRLSGAHGGRARGGQAAGRCVSLGRGVRGAPRLGRPGGVVLARARTCTTTRLSGAHGGRARGGQAAGRYVLPRVFFHNLSCSEGEWGPPQSVQGRPGPVGGC